MDRNSDILSNDGTGAVALRKESVDRNAGSGRTERTGQGSLSARRAWIEMIKFRSVMTGNRVALRKESVDRNVMIEALNPDVLSRSPQGERG